MRMMEDPKDAWDGAIKGLAVFYDNPFLDSVRRVMRDFPDCDVESSLNQYQIQSKKWLLESLEATRTDLGCVFILGGWYGVLAALICERQALRANEIHSFDIDQSCAVVATAMNRHLPSKKNVPFHAWTGDIYKLNLIEPNHTQVEDHVGKTINCPAPRPNVIINTVCEHLPDMKVWLAGVPEDTLVVLQSNNYFAEPTHINCVESLEAFKAQCQLKHLAFAGELKLKRYTRYMLIGTK